jgi:hypothetical protein
VEGTGVGVYGQSADRRLSISLGKHATVFQAEEYMILACVHETETQDRSEKYVSICSDSQAALKVLQAAKTTYPLVLVQEGTGQYLYPAHCGAVLGPWACQIARK